MKGELQIYNTLTRRKEIFVPLHSPFVGMYLCGLTVYNDAHIGNARGFITFDMIYRYLLHLGYKVRYVRNITDVGHLEDELADAGEDKIAKQAKLEKLEPMEVVQHYTNRFREVSRRLNLKDPAIEPTASGHIIEQIEMIKEILKTGLAYEVNGSVYFNVEKYNASGHYGKLSGRVLDELVAHTRALEGQEEKKHPFDFALWKKAKPEHIMRWPSPWGDGFPGWHLECSVMSSKYLGQPFDIHGGGMDLIFPHHECEIAQSQAAKGIDPVRYWVHNNMLTINGQKMSKSQGNFITVDQLLKGDHTLIEWPCSPITFRFFIFQAHYRGTLDFSAGALQASEKALKRLTNGEKTLDDIKPSAKSSVNINEINDNCYRAMNDDFNTPVLIARLFDGLDKVRLLKERKETIDEKDLSLLKKIYHEFFHDILGLSNEEGADKIPQQDVAGKLMEIILSLREEARNNKDFATSDRIRDALAGINVCIKDGKKGATWMFGE